MLADKFTTPKGKAEYNNIRTRLGSSIITLVRCTESERPARMKQLMADRKRQREMLLNTGRDFKSVGPISVSGNLFFNITEALRSWWSTEDVDDLLVSLEKRRRKNRDFFEDHGVDFHERQLEAVDLLQHEKFSELTGKYIPDCATFIFEIPEGELGNAYGQLCQFLRIYNDHPQYSSVYVVGSAENLLSLIANVSVMGKQHRVAEIIR